jgi:hypothetical protein
MSKENPASRLHELLESANKYHPGTPFRNVWSKVFDVEPTDTSSLLLRYNKLLELYFSTKEYILSNPRLNNDRNIGFIDKIGQAVAFIDINGTNVNFRNTLDSETLTALHYLAENISLVYDLEASVISPDQISE